jgi:hypothetical protein
MPSRGVMRRWVIQAATLALVAAACGGGEPAIATSSPGIPLAGQPIVIRLRLIIADAAGAEIPATGEVLEGSTLAGDPFCPGGTSVDRHASEDPAMQSFGLLDRTITCSDGTVRIGFTPGLADGLSQRGVWTMVSGTGAFEDLHGTGDMEVTYDPVDDSLAHETLTGVVIR